MVRRYEDDSGNPVLDDACQARVERLFKEITPKLEAIISCQPDASQKFYRDWLRVLKEQEGIKCSSGKLS